MVCWSTCYESCCESVLCDQIASQLSFVLVMWSSGLIVRNSIANLCLAISSNYNF